MKITPYSPKKIQRFPVNLIRSFATLTALTVFTHAGAQSNATVQDLAIEVESLKAIVKAQQDEIQNLRNKMDDFIPTKRETEEVKTIVQEVLADPEVQAGIMEPGPTAGHDGKNFFFANSDKSFGMKVSGQIQGRYMYNNREGDTIDGDELGFQLRRAKVNFKGHIANPKMNYNVTVASDRKVNSLDLEDAVFQYKFGETLNLEVGRRKLPFLREELTSSKRQLPVERSSVNEFFTLNRGEGLWFNLKSRGGSAKATVAISDGQNSGNIGGGPTKNNDFDADRTDFAITTRGDLKFGGNFKQMDDFAAWSGEDSAFFLSLLTLTSTKRLFQDDGSIAAIVRRPSGGSADFLCINFSACLKLQNVSGNSG